MINNRSLHINRIISLFCYILIINVINCSDVRDKKITGPKDPLFKNQWHLQNTGQGGGVPGMDMNVIPVWTRGYYGAGVTIAVVDDGLEYTHEDLSANMRNTLNHNYITNNTNINGGTHGTSVAGVAAAVHENYSGGKGAAPEAWLVGYNLLQSYDTSNEQDAMVRNINDIDISNNSWGPPDGSGQLDISPATWKSGIVDGITHGRNEKGIVYTWAAGNGGKFYKSSTTEVDNSNYDGYANFYGVTAVCALGDDGKRSYYSEKGANLWVCTYSNGGVSGITTTDLTGSKGYNNTSNYTSTFGGTSSASPLAAGAVALILDANPNLTWRDVKIILAKTAVMIDPTDSDWTTNGAGYHINHKYGFGSIDANAAVNLALTWTNVGAFKSDISSPVNTPNSPIIDFATVTNIITVAGSGVSSIEYVAVTIEINHTDAGDLEISLQSPQGTVSVLAEKHPCANITTGISSKCTWYDGTGISYTFGTARNLEEPADGNWTLTVKDLAAVDTGTLNSWSMTFYGR